MCTLLGWRLCKCTNLAGFAWVQAGSWIMAPALLAGRTHLKEQQVENECHIIFFCPSPPLLLYLSFVLSVSLGWVMATAQIGKSCGRFGKCLFPPLTLFLPSLCVVIDWREVTFKMKSRSVRKNVKAFMLSHGININPPPTPSTPSLFAYSPLLYPFPFAIVSGSVALLSLSFLSPWAALSLCLSLSLALFALCLLLDRLSVCLRLCARVLTRETERERVQVSVYSLMRLCVCVCVRAAVPAGRLR